MRPYFGIIGSSRGTRPYWGIAAMLCRGLVVGMSRTGRFWFKLSLSRHRW